LFSSNFIRKSYEFYFAAAWLSPVHMASWWCKPAVVMDYHRQLVRQNDGDSYQPGRSYELTVILPSPMVRITNRW
jgi:hypothetical protein